MTHPLIRPLALLGLMLPVAATAATFQDTATLDRAVAGFTGQWIGMQGGARTPVDPRLRLASCPMIAMSWRTASHDAVVISCSGPAWRIFVAVAMPATTTTTTTPGAVVGPVVRAEPVIKRGDPVMIEAESNGFAISREGVAMGDAAPGGRFMVKVDDTRNPVQAVAVASGRATLPGWTE